MEPVIEYRRGQPRHVHQILNLWKGRRMVGYDVIDRVKGQIRSYPSMVAHAGPMLVGFVYGEESAPSVYRVENIKVDESYHGREIGTRILQLLEQEAAKADYEALEAYTDRSDIEAERLYLTAGFIRDLETSVVKRFTKEVIQPEV